jgi:hypothetical protein
LDREDRARDGGRDRGWNGERKHWLKEDKARIKGIVQGVEGGIEG